MDGRAVLWAESGHKDKHIHQQPCFLSPMVPKRVTWELYPNGSRDCDAGDDRGSCYRRQGAEFHEEVAQNKG